MIGSQTFSHDCRSFLAYMSSTRLDSVDLLVHHLDFRSRLDRAAVEQESAQSEEMSNRTWDVLFEDAFRTRLIRYLYGTGHPNHPDVVEVSGQAIFDRDRDDPLLRARLFLQMMSGSDLVPINKEWQFKVCLSPC